MHVSSAGTSSVEGQSCLSMPFRIVCLSFHMCFPWSCLCSWACVHMTRHCVDSGGSVLILIFLFQRHGLCVVPFVTLPSVCSHFTWKDSWCERHTHHERRGKNIANDAALAGRSHVAVSAVASQLSAYHGQALRETAQAFGQVQKNALATAPNVVCTTCERCSDVLTHFPSRNRRTRPPLNVFVAHQICVVVP